MVVAVEAHFPALPQQQPAKIAERLGVALAEGRVGGVVLIVLDHDARVPDAEPLGQLDEVRPPDLGVEIRDVQAVILPDVLAVALRHRRGKVVQKKDGAVEHRVGAGLPQQAVRGRIKASHDLVVDADVVHHHPALAEFGAPNQRDALVPGDGIHRRIVPQLHRHGGFERVAQLIPLPAAQQKALGRHDALGRFAVPRRGQHPKFLGHHIERPALFGRHRKEDIAALLHPVHQVEQAQAQRLEVRHQHHDGLVVFKGRKCFRGGVGKVCGLGGDLHILQDLFQLFFCLCHAHLAAVAEQQADGGLPRQCFFLGQGMVERPDLNMGRGVLHPAALRKQSPCQQQEHQPDQQQPAPPEPPLPQPVHAAPPFQNASSCRPAALR